MLEVWEIAEVGSRLIGDEVVRHVSEIFHIQIPTLRLPELVFIGADSQEVSFEVVLHTVGIRLVDLLHTSVRLCGVRAVVAVVDPDRGRQCSSKDLISGDVQRSTHVVHAEIDDPGLRVLVAAMKLAIVVQLRITVDRALHPNAGRLLIFLGDMEPTKMVRARTL